MKRIILAIFAATLLSRCGVQQFPVNTTTQPFAEGGVVFGEKTRGKEFKKKREFFIIGINVYNVDTKKMAEEIKADYYTIETKENIFTGLLKYITFGIVEYKIVKVIKRTN